MRLSNLIPAEYEYCIAGGYAAHPLTAKDVDVWVMQTSKEVNAQVPLESTRIAVLNHVTRLGFEVDEETTEEQGDYRGVAILVMKVGVVSPYSPLPIHLMVTDAPVVDAILDNFDISTHQIALLPSGKVVTGQAWTPLNAPPQVIPGRRNEHTPGRLRKITDRYKEFRHGKV